MNKLTIKKLVREATRLEGGKKSISIAQMEEVFGIVSDMMVSPNNEEVKRVLESNGLRRLKLADKKVVKRKAVKKGSKKVAKKKVLTKKKVAKKATKKKVAKKKAKVVTAPSNSDLNAMVH